MGRKFARFQFYTPMYIVPLRSHIHLRNMCDMPRAWLPVLPPSPMRPGRTSPWAWRWCLQPSPYRTYFWYQCTSRLYPGSLRSPSRVSTWKCDIKSRIFSCVVTKNHIIYLNFKGIQDVSIRDLFSFLISLISCSPYSSLTLFYIYNDRYGTKISNFDKVYIPYVM